MLDQAITNALLHLRHGEVCGISFKDGSRGEATWNAVKYLFYYFYDGMAGAPIDNDVVEEWWPASVKY